MGLHPLSFIALYLYLNMVIILYMREIWGKRLESSSKREIESLGELWTALGEVVAAGSLYLEVVCSLL